MLNTTTVFENNFKAMASVVYLAGVTKICEQFLHKIAVLKLL